MAFYAFVRLEPQPGSADRVRQEMKLVVEATRTEPGCGSIHAFESVRDPVIFYIHSTWTDEAAFDEHARLPHTQRFLAAVVPLLTEDVRAVRTKPLY